MPAAVWAKLELLHTILATLAPYTPIALIVMFQAELRRALARLGRRPFLGISQLERRELSQEVVLAVGRLSQTKVGALIVIERKIGLRTFIESGVSLDALVSRDLLCSIFHPGGTLHDGAVIIQGDRISAAACFLPLTTNPLLVTELGTRHRAALGISEESDCIAIVVSEETGKVSVAAFGEIELDVPLERVEHLLSERLDRDEKRNRQRIAQRALPRQGASVQLWIVHVKPARSRRALGGFVLRRAANVRERFPMIQLFTRNLGWKLLSLLIAVALVAGGGARAGSGHVALGSGGFQEHAG